MYMLVHIFESRVKIAEGLDLKSINMKLINGVLNVTAFGWSLLVIRGIYIRRRHRLCVVE